MTSLYEQQKTHREWLKEAGGDLRVVEPAIVTAVDRAKTDNRQATSDEVIAEIRKQLHHRVEYA